MGQDQQVHCNGNNCPFIEETGSCIHRIQIDKEYICVLDAQHRVHTHEEIAKIMGISKQSVIYLEKKALDKMKQKMLSNLRKEGLEETDLFA